MGKTLALVLVALFLTSLVTVSSITLVKAETAWNIQIVDPESSDDPPVIQIDSHNNPHIAYYAYEGGNYQSTEYLRYASWNGTGWNIQNVVEKAYNINLALDSKDNPCLLYTAHIPTTSNMGIYYATLNDSKWNIQNVGIGISGALALDSQDNPHITYFSENNAIVYASWNGTHLNKETIDDSQSFDTIRSLKIDSKNNLHIIYDYNNGDLYLSTVKYAQKIGSVWMTQTVISNITRFSLGNMVLDSSDFPHFTYAVNRLNLLNGTSIMYMSWNGSAWVSQVLASDIPWRAGDKAFLTLDREDYPQIVYFIFDAQRIFFGDLIYARWNGTAWDSETVDSNSYGRAQIVLDLKGNPHVCYPSKINEPERYTATLMYATATEPNSTSNTDAFAIIAQMLPIIVAVVVLAVILVSIILYRKHRKTISQTNQRLREKE